MVYKHQSPGVRRMDWGGGAPNLWVDSEIKALKFVPPFFLGKESSQKGLDISGHERNWCSTPKFSPRAMKQHLYFY